MIVEVLVATLVLAVGLIATVATFDATRHEENGSAALQAASHAGSQAMEQVLADGYLGMGLISAPAPSSDPLDPDFYVTAGSPGTYQWDQRSGASGSAATEPLVIDPGALVDPGPTAWGDAHYGGRIYRYVSWACDVAVAGAANCPGHHDFKRVTVAVTISTPTTLRRPLVFQTLVSDPNAGPSA